MSRTRDFFEQQKTRLFDKHPELRNAVVKSPADFGLSVADWASFIERCWTTEYGEEPRIRFIPEFIEYVWPEGFTEDTLSIATKIDGELASLLLVIGMDYIGPDGSPLQFDLGTALSTAPTFRGRGLTQLSYLALSERQLDRGHDGLVGWVDLSHDHTGSSHHIFTKNPQLEAVSVHAIMAKPLATERLVELGLLGRKRGTAARLLQAVFPPRLRAPRGYTFQPFEEGWEQSCADFFLAWQRCTVLRRVLKPEELRQRFTFSQSPVHGLCYMLIREGAVAGLIFGYTNPIQGSDCYFAIDGVLFHPQLGYRARRAFLASAEAAARDNYGCCAALLPPGVCNDSIVKYGYVTLCKHILTGTSYTENVEMRESLLKDIFLELR